MDNPQLQAVHHFLETQLTEATDLSLEGMRANLDNASKLVPPLPGVTSEAVDTGIVRSEWFRPADADEGRAILFVHGGGYMLGSIESHRDLAGRIAIAARAPTLAFEYRLAPEHPFPAGLEDTIASYRWLIREGGYDPSKVALVGESAGGGLALGTALELRDSEDIKGPAALACMSAWTDLSCSLPSLTEADDPSIKAPYVVMMAQAYLAGQDAKTPSASPLYADLAGLPTMLLQAGTADALRDDTLRFAERCKEAGVDVTVELWDDMFHAFQLWAAMLDDGKRAIDQLGEFVRRQTS